MDFLWHPDMDGKENSYVLFRGTIDLERAEEIEIKVIAKDNYRFYIDREEKAFGPARFAPLYPEYTVIKEKLEEGSHEIICLVHQYGIDTRFSDRTVPCFFLCEVTSGKKVYNPGFKVAQADCFIDLHKRNNPLLGWMEYIDYRRVDEIKKDIHVLEFKEPVKVDYKYKEIRKQKIRDIKDVHTPGLLLDEGVFIDRFGYANDNPAVRFMMRDLKTKFQPRGVWKRFDLGHVGLYRPEIKVKAPRGTVMEAGYSSFLFQDRVNPVIALTGDASHNLDRFILSGGEETVTIFNYRGLRYIEVHVYGNPDDVDIYHANAGQRTYYPEIRGSFECESDLLNDIWEMGAMTVRNCSEDALTDTPVRERGQWTGDMMASGIENISLMFGEMSLPARSIIQAFEMRDPRGFVPAQYPGHIDVIPMYSLMWITGSLRYYEITGDKKTIEYVYPGMHTTIDSFMENISEKGILKPEGTTDFIDWGYHHIMTGLNSPANEINITLNICLMGTIKKLVEYNGLFGDKTTDEKHKKYLKTLEKIMDGHFYNEKGLLKKYEYTDRESTQEGFNSNALALYYNLIPENKKETVIDYIKKFILNSYPANPKGSMMYDPNTDYNDTITPYFSHFTMAALIENGEMDFVVEQYKTFWGWMIEQGMTTAAEVFDIRWSHCHAWSACPSWQLSRYVLGVWPKNGKILFRPYSCKLEKAKGYFPDTDIHVQYRRNNGVCEYILTHGSETKLEICLPEGRNLEGQVKREGETRTFVHIRD